MQRFILDLVRVGVLVGLVGFGLYLLDPSNVVVFQSLGIAIFMVGGTHLTRRLLFNRIDLQSIARIAVEEGSIPAAIVFCAVVFFLVAVMFLSMSVLK